QRAERRLGIGERAARDELPDHPTRRAVNRRARARELDGGRTYADTDEHRLAGGGAAVLGQRELVPAGARIDGVAGRQLDAAGDLAVTVGAQGGGQHARRADAAAIAGL